MWVNNENFKNFIYSQFKWWSPWICCHGNFYHFSKYKKILFKFWILWGFLPQIWHLKSSMELSLFTYFSMDFTSFKVTSKCAFFDNHFLQKRATFQSIITFLLLILFMKTYYEKWLTNVYFYESETCKRHESINFLRL